MTLQDKKDELLEIALKWYSNEDHEPISDMEFDRMEREIREEDPDWDYRLLLDIQGSDRKHYLSMEKVSKMQEVERSMDEVQEDMLLNPNSQNSPKYDGGGLCLYYKNGVLYDALTRSSTATGKSQLAKVSSMVPKFIEDEDIMAIECEAICTLDKGHGDLSRQAATGLLNSNSLQDRCEKELTIVGFKVRYKDGVEKDWVQGVKNLPTLRNGNNITFIPTPFNEGDYEGNKFYHKDFSALIDGIVEYVDGKSLAHKLYFNEKKVSKVLKIEWNHNPSSLKYVPKYDYKDVKVDGTNCGRATGGGTAQLKKMKCGVGAGVEIIKAGLTIPQVFRPTSEIVSYIFETSQVPDSLRMIEALKKKNLEYKLGTSENDLAVIFSCDGYEMKSVFKIFRSYKMEFTEYDEKQRQLELFSNNFELPKNLKKLPNTDELVIDFKYGILLNSLLEEMDSQSVYNTSEDYGLPTKCGCSTEEKEVLLTWNDELNGGLYCSNPHCSVNMKVLDSHLVEDLTKYSDLKDYICKEPIRFVERYLKCPRFNGWEKFKNDQYSKTEFINELLKVETTPAEVVKKYFNLSGLQSDVMDKVTEVVKSFMIKNLSEI